MQLKFKNMKYSKEYSFLILIIGILIFVPFSFQDSLAITPEWIGNVNMNQGAVIGAGLPSIPITVTVTDMVEAGADTITVRITSSVDPVGFDLTLNEDPLGTFKNRNLALMPENGFATTSSSLTITVFI